MQVGCAGRTRDAAVVSGSLACWLAFGVFFGSLAFWRRGWWCFLLLSGLERAFRSFPSCGECSLRGLDARDGREGAVGVFGPSACWLVSRGFFGSLFFLFSFLPRGCGLFWRAGFWLGLGGGFGLGARSGTQQRGDAIRATLGSVAKCPGSQAFSSGSRALDRIRQRPQKSYTFLKVADCYGLRTGCLANGQPCGSW